MSIRKRGNPPQLRFKLSVVQKDGSLARVSTGRINNAPRLRMHQNQRIRADVLPLVLQGQHERRPSLVGDSTTLPPLLNGPSGFADSVSHVGNGVPNAKDFFEGVDEHGSVIARDKLSRQAGTNVPVTKTRRGRTMCPMSRAVTPTSFKRDFCERLKAARVMANYDQVTLAEALGISANTYGKYERRSLLPHYLIPKVCALLGITADQLFHPVKEKRKTA